MIKECLTQGARQAARDLAVWYVKDTKTADNPSMEASEVYSNIHIDQIIIHDPNRFSATWYTNGPLPSDRKVRVQKQTGQTVSTHIGMYI